MGIMPTSAIVVLSVSLLVIIVLAGIVLLLRRQKRQQRSLHVSRRDQDHVKYAFIINPSKPRAGELKEHIIAYCKNKGIDDIQFIETTLEKDGSECAEEALAQGAGVVVAVGGDGTVRTVASALASTDHALGIIPIGTGNLFARNVGIPVDDIDAALGVATSHGSRQIDMGRVALLDSDEPDRKHGFLIIAGIGFDALMIDDTDPTLKKNISWLAYFVSGVKHLFAPKFKASLTLTDDKGHTHEVAELAFRTFMAGNCGEIPGFSLMPEASFDDGMLDFEIIDTSGGLIGWANLFGDVVHQTITGKAQQSPLSTNSTIEQMQGPKAELRLEKPSPAQVDGDVLGETRHIEITIEPRALCVRVPKKDMS